MKNKAVCANKRCQAEAGTPLRNCGQCKAVGYCSQICQKQHWPEHKRVCRDGLRDELNDKTVDLLERATRMTAEDGFPKKFDLLVKEIANADVESVKGKRAQKASEQFSKDYRERYATKSPDELAEFQEIFDSMADMNREEALEFYHNMRSVRHR